MNSQKLACPRETKEVVLHTGCSYEIPCFRTLGICRVFRFKKRLDKFMEGNPLRITAHTWIVFGLGSPWAAKCWRLERVLKKNSCMTVQGLSSFLPCHLQCHRATNKVSIHPAHEVTPFPRLHPQTSLLWGSLQDNREQKKVTNTISEMNLEEKRWSVSWTWTWMQSEQWHLSAHHFSPVWCTISFWDSSWGIQEAR